MVLKDRELITLLGSPSIVQEEKDRLELKWLAGQKFYQKGGVPPISPIRAADYKGTTTNLVRATYEFNKVMIAKSEKEGLRAGSLIRFKKPTWVGQEEGDWQFYITELNQRDKIDWEKWIDGKEGDPVALYLGPIWAKTRDGGQYGVQRWLVGQKIVLANVASQFWEIVSS